MPILFGFDGDHGTDVRPVHKAAAKPWAKDESLPGADDGTRLTASLVNALAANLRDLVSVAAVTGAESDDTLVRRAILALVATALDALAVADIDGLTAALAAKASLVSPALTGTPTAPTAAPGTNTQQIATTAFVLAVRDALISSAPGALDTLNEIAAALGNDANYAASVTAALAGKLAKASNLSDLTDAAAARTALGLGSAATKNTGTAAGNVVALDGSGRLPAVDGSQVTGLAAAPVSSVAGKIGAVTLDKNDVGLGNVNNTSDASKPVSTAQQAALDAKLDKAGGALTGNVTFGPSAAKLAVDGGLWSAFAGGTSGAVYLGNTGAKYLFYDGTNYYLPGAPLVVNGGVAWHSFNDGAASGLDADLLDGYHASSFPIYATSGQISFAVGTDMAFAHGLGATPKKVEAYMECVTADSPFAVGARIFISTEESTVSARGGTLWANATNVYFSMNASGVFYLTGNGYNGWSPTLTSWRLVLSASL